MDYMKSYVFVFFDDKIYLLKTPEVDKMPGKTKSKIKFFPEVEIF